MARPKATLMGHDNTELSVITKAENVLFENGDTAQSLLDSGYDKMFTPTIESSKSMFKVGQGDSVDYSTNIVDGAYEGCVLKGRTLVNIAPSSYAVGGGYLRNEVTMRASVSTGTDEHRVKQFRPVYSLKVNTKYAIAVKVTEMTNTSYLSSYLKFNDDTYQYGVFNSLTKIGNYIIPFTVGLKEVKEVAIYLQDNVDATISAKIKEVMLFEYQDGIENWGIPYFEGMCDVKSPILSNVGKNLFNINSSKRFLNGSPSIEVMDNVLTVKTNGTGSWQNVSYDIPVRPNTKYVLSMSDRNVANSGYNLANVSFGNTVLSTTGSSLSVKEMTFTTPSNCNVVIVRFYCASDTGVNGGMAIYSDIQLREYSVPSTYEPYKTNILSANGDRVELTEDMFEQGGAYFTKGQSFANATNNTDTTRIRLKTLLNLKPNTTYRVDIDGDAYKVGVQIYNSEKLGVSDTGWVSNTTFTTKNGENAVVLVVRKLSSTANLSVSDFKNTKLQLSEVDKTIVLRSLPNGVCDTLNVETGEYVQRIGEMVLDGNENWIIHNNSNSNRIIFKTSSKLKGYTIKDSISNKIRTSSILGGISDLYGYSFLRIGENVDAPTYGVFLHLENDLLSLSDVDKLVTWLKENPITVQYELANPLVRKVSLSGFPYAYTNGHVILESGSVEQSLLPKVEYSLSTNRIGQIQTNQKMIEKHQKEIDELQKIILTNMVNSQYQQALTMLNYELSRV